VVDADLRQRGCM